MVQRLDAGSRATYAEGSRHPDGANQSQGWVHAARDLCGMRCCSAKVEQQLDCYQFLKKARLLCCQQMMTDSKTFATGMALCLIHRETQLLRRGHPGEGS
jgi:hypothetical protein